MALNFGMGSSTESGRQQQYGTQSNQHDLGSRDVNVLIDQIMGNYRQRTGEDIQAVSLANAQRDSKSVVDNIFTQYQEEALPEIFTASESAGVYGSSGAQTLANDAYARTVSNASELTMGLANTYSNQLLQEQNQVDNLITSLFQLDMEQTGLRRTTTSQRGTSTGKGFNMGMDVGMGGGAGGGPLSGGG